MLLEKPRHTLYLCYFGLLEPLVQTQVLPYLREIKKIGDLKISLLTFEPDFHERWTSEKIQTEKNKLAKENIDWHCLPYHKRPSVPATLYDVARGAIFTWKMIREERTDILHARVHIPALMAVIARKFSRQKPKLLFDIRGFFPEEYTDAGIWKENGWIYRVVKQIEKWLLNESAGFVVLTERAREILFPNSRKTGFDGQGRPVEVIPCCVDLNRFETSNENSRSKIRKRLGVDDRKVIVYSGSFGGWYLTEEMLDFFSAARAENSVYFLLVLTQRDSHKVIGKLKERGLAEGDFRVESVSPFEIPLYLSAADIAVSFIKSCYSKQSSSPTKIAEYLASGVPVIANRGVGDIDKLISDKGVGVLLADFSKDSYLNALEQVVTLRNESDFKENCRICVKSTFDLDNVGGTKYRNIYVKLLNGSKSAL